MPLYRLFGVFFFCCIRQDLLVDDAFLELMTEIE